MSFSEALVKIIFWPRIRKAKRIGEAAELIGEGRAEETLEILAKMERRIPPYIGFLFFLTRGRAFEALERWDDAEEAYTAAVFAKEGANVAYVHLAVLCGRQRRFDETTDWIHRIRADDQVDDELAAQADQLEELLDDVVSGRRREELRHRAEAFSRQHDLDDLTLAQAMPKLDEWIENHVKTVGDECDELACYLGERVIAERDGRWLVSLNLEDSHVEVGEENFEPFVVVRARLDEEQSLVDFLE